MGGFQAEGAIRDPKRKKKRKDSPDKLKNVQKIKNLQNWPENQQLGPKLIQDESPSLNNPFPNMFGKFPDKHLQQKHDAFGIIVLISFLFIFRLNEVNDHGDLF